MRTLSIFLLLTACATSSTNDTHTTSMCPPINDACMNEDNYQECLDVEANCDGHILIMESCPLQFGCDD